MGNPLIDLPAEASPQEILAQEEGQQFQGQGYDLPAEGSPIVLEAARLIQDRFRERGPAKEERSAASRFAGAAAGSAIGALGGGDAAGALELMAHAAKRSKVLQPLLQAGGGMGEKALGLLQDAAHDWAAGANQVKQWALPDAARKGDMAERGGEIAGGLAGLGGVAAQFGAAGLAATGAGQQAAPVYFHVLAKTGSEEKAIQAAMPALGIGATYALPLGKIIAGAGEGTFAKLLLSGLGEGALGATQQVATDAILKKATGEEMKFLQDGAEAGAFGFLTTTVLGMLHMAGAKLVEKAPVQTAQEAPGAKQAEEAPAVSEADRAWAERFLARPEPKEGPIGAPSEIDEALGAADAAEKAGGKIGVPIDVRTRARHSMAAKPSLSEPVEVPKSEEEAQALVDRLWQVGKDHGVPQAERMKAMQRISSATDEKAVHDEFLSIVDRWQEEGLLPKKVIEDVPPEPETAAGKKIRLSGQIDAMGKAIGASDEEILRARKTMEALPGELDPEEEFTRIASDLRRRSGGAAPIAAVEVNREPPKPDATEEMLYGGLPPLFRSKKVSGAAVKQKLADGIRKRGATPEQAFLAAERAAGEVNAQATQQKILSRRLERAMVKEWGRKAAEGKEAAERIQAALTDPDAMMALPESIRPHAIALRAHADQNARTMVSEGMVDTPMAKTFESGLGKHLRRQYQAHSDPEWAQKIEPEVRNRLKSLLVSWAEPLEKTKEQELKGKIADKKSPTMARRAAEYELESRQALQGKGEDEIVAQMEHMLADAKAVAENPWAAIGAAKLKRKDLSLFKARKGLPEEMRAFLGEVKDPLANYVSTVMKQAQVIAAHRKFKAMREEGLGKYLFEAPTIKNGVEYVVEVTSGSNKALEPLTKGKPLYTSEAIQKALFATQPAQTSKMWKWSIAANAFLKTAKTVWSPVTIAKQVPQNFTTALRAGHAFAWPKYARETLAILTGKDEAGLLEATRHGLIGESVAAAEYRDLKASLADKKLHPTYQGVVNAHDFMGHLFQYPDTFAKVAGWKVETARLVESGMGEAAAKREAADIVRNVYPTVSRIHPFVNKWRKQPLFGTFMGWNSEKIRTTAELYKLIRSELESGSPELRANALKRIGWAVAGTAAMPAAVISYNMLNGIDKEEDRDRREHLPPWAKEKNVFWIGEKKKGSYITASDIDSNAWTTDAVSRLIAGDKIEDILTEVFREDLAPFVEPSMLTQAVVEQISGRDYEHGIERDRADMLFKRVRPGIAQALQMKHGKVSVRDGELGRQLIGLSGMKPQPFDVAESLKYSQYDLLDALQKAKADEPARRAAFKEASAKAQSAIGLGLSPREARKILDEKFGDATIDAILSGGYIPYKPRKQQ